MKRVRARLKEREKRAVGLFPDHAALWARWREVVELLDRSYLKADLETLLCEVEPPERLRPRLDSALGSISRDDESSLVDLLQLAGIENYDRRTGRLSFDPKDQCAEALLYGWLEG